MKKLVSVGVVPLLFALITTFSGSASAQDREGSEGTRERFIGAWRLVWLDPPPATAKPPCPGLVSRGSTTAVASK